MARRLSNRRVWQTFTARSIWRESIGCGINRFAASPPSLWSNWPLLKPLSFIRGYTHPHPTPHLSVLTPSLSPNSTHLPWSLCQKSLWSLIESCSLDPRSTPPLYLSFSLERFEKEGIWKREDERERERGRYRMNRGSMKEKGRTLSHTNFSTSISTTILWLEDYIMVHHLTKQMKLHVRCTQPHNG